MGMTKEELKDVVKKNTKDAYEKLIDDEIKKTGKNDDFTKEDFENVLKNVKNHIEEKIKEKAGKS